MTIATTPSLLPSTAGALAEALGARIAGPADAPVERLAALEDADDRSLSFIRSDAHLPRLAASRAGALLVPLTLSPERLAPTPDGDERALLLVENVDRALLRLLGLLDTGDANAAFAVPPPAPGETAIHPTAVVHPTARIGRGVLIGPHVTVGARCEIGDGSIIHAGVVIGSDGFGYVPREDGRGIEKVPHIGNVVIGRGVEIGANTCIDRGKFGSTVIGDGTKIDNLVHIAHNCRIGRSCIICGQCALSGSVTLGDGVTLAGSVVIVDHITVGDGATVGGRSGVMNNIPPGETWIGTPAVPNPAGMANLAAMRHLGEYLRRFRRLQKALDRDLPDGV